MPCYGTARRLPRTVADAAAVRLGQHKENIQVVVMRFLVDGEDHAAHLLAVQHDAVSFTFGIVDRSLNGRAGDDLAVLVNMVVALKSVGEVLKSVWAFIKKIATYEIGGKK